MDQDRQWYLAWRPGAIGYDHDATILAIGLRSRQTAVPVQDVISWLGSPDKVMGSREMGHLAYFFEDDSEEAAFFDVRGGRATGFGTITRNADNAKRQDEQAGEESCFNILDDMVAFADSEMEMGTAEN